MENQNLPTIKDLIGDEPDMFKHDGWNLLLNTAPPNNWVTKHPFAKDVTYLTIQRIETLLTRLFQQWRVEVISYNQVFNSVSCHVRLHYLNPISKEWQYHDGLGAVGVQTDKGASASDLSAIKQDAVMKALPAAKSFAIKDAAGHLGKLFGRDLNRKDYVEFKPQYNTQWNK